MKKPKYPKQTLLKSGTKIRSKGGVRAVVMKTSKRTKDGFILYKLKYTMKTSNGNLDFVGSGLFTAEQLQNAGKLKEPK